MPQGSPIGLLITLLKAGRDAVYPILPLQSVQFSVTPTQKVSLSANPRISVILNVINSIPVTMPVQVPQKVILPEVEGSV